MGGEGEVDAVLTVHVLVDGEPAGVERVSERSIVGRSGAGALRVDDPYFHSVGFLLQPVPSAWSVATPDRGRYNHRSIEVAIHAENEPVARLSYDDRHFLTTDAILEVKTAASAIRFDVRWSGAVRDETSGGRTLDPSEMAVIDLSKRAHRAIVLSCGDRLFNSAGKAASAKEIGRVLGTSQDGARQLLRRGRKDLSGWICAPGEVATSLELIDWLVASRIVNEATYQLATQMEQAPARCSGNLKDVG